MSHLRLDFHILLLLEIMITCVRYDLVFSFFQMVKPTVSKPFIKKSILSLMDWKWHINHTLKTVSISHTHIHIHTLALSHTHMHKHRGIYFWIFILPHWFVCPFLYLYCIIKIIWAHNNILISGTVTLLFKFFLDFSTFNSSRSEVLILGHVSQLAVKCPKT